MQLPPTLITSSDHVKKSDRARPHFALLELGLRFSERGILLAIIDLLIVNATLFLALMLRSELTSPLWGDWWLPWFLFLSALWLLIGMLFNIYDLAKAASTMHSVWSASCAVLLTGVLYWFIPFITPTLPDRRLEMFFFPLLTMIGIALWRVVYATVFVQPAFQHTALIIGMGWCGHTLANAIVESGNGKPNPYRGTGYQILGFIDDDPAKQELAIAGIPVLGTRYDLVRLAKELNPDEIILAITYSQLIHPELFQAILDCRELGFPITSMKTLYERMTGRVPVEHAGRDLDVVLPMSRPAAHRLYLVGRRIIEIMIVISSVPLLLLMIPFIWLINLLTAPGDLFYRQQRVGKSGYPFDVIKFRTMIMDAEKQSGAVWASQNDKRITPIGRILRKTRLDELPQLWNILKGEMSLIGPRPERPHFVTQLAEEIPFYRVRHAIKPGLTGWAQVKYTYGASIEDALVKLQYDLYYIKHQGPYLDLLILIQTIRVVLGFKGR